MLISLLSTGLIVLRRGQRDLQGWALLMGAAFLLYVAVSIGLMLWAVMRLNAWKKAHPWTPPTARAARRGSAKPG